MHEEFPKLLMSKHKQDKISHRDYLNSSVSDHPSKFAQNNLEAEIPTFKNIENRKKSINDRQEDYNRKYWQLSSPSKLKQERLQRKFYQYDQMGCNKMKQNRERKDKKKVHWDSHLENTFASTKQSNQWPSSQIKTMPPFQANLSRTKSNSKLAFPEPQVHSKPLSTPKNLKSINTPLYHTHLQNAPTHHTPINYSSTNVPNQYNPTHYSSTNAPLQPITYLSPPTHHAAPIYHSLPMQNHIIHPQNVTYYEPIVSSIPQSQNKHKTTEKQTVLYPKNYNPNDKDNSELHIYVEQPCSISIGHQYSEQNNQKYQQLPKTNQKQWKQEQKQKQNQKQKQRSKQKYEDSQSQKPKSQIYLTAQQYQKMLQKQYNLQHELAEQRKKNDNKNKPTDQISINNSKVSKIQQTSKINRNTLPDHTAMSKKTYSPSTNYNDKVLMYPEEQKVQNQHNFKAMRCSNPIKVNNSQNVMNMIGKVSNIDNGNTNYHNNKNINKNNGGQTSYNNGTSSKVGTTKTTTKQEYQVTYNNHNNNDNDRNYHKQNNGENLDDLDNKIHNLDRFCEDEEIKEQLQKLKDIKDENWRNSFGYIEKMDKILAKYGSIPPPHQNCSLQPKQQKDKDKDKDQEKEKDKNIETIIEQKTLSNSKVTPYLSYNHNRSSMVPKHYLSLAKNMTFDYEKI